MSESITLDIQFFGPCREFYTEIISLTVPKGSNNVFIKKALGEELHRLNGSFDGDILLKQCALATNSLILNEATHLTENTQLTVLPPVCGG